MDYELNNQIIMNDTEKGVDINQNKNKDKEKEKEVIKSLNEKAESTLSQKVAGGFLGSIKNVANSAVDSLINKLPQYGKNYFQITSDIIKRRLINGVKIYNNNLYDEINENPDIYGPFWIYTTVVFCLAASGSLYQYINDKTTSTTFSEYVSVTSFWIYLIGFIFPLVIVFLSKYIGGNITYIKALCLYGYSFSIFIPISLICVFFNSFIDWLVLLYCGFSTSYILIINLSKTFPAEVEIKKKYIVLGVITAFQIILILFLSYYFFYTVPKTSSNIGTNVNNSNIIKNITDSSTINNSNNEVNKDSSLNTNISSIKEDISSSNLSTNLNDGKENISTVDENIPNYDIYVLALTWMPTYCKFKSKDEYSCLNEINSIGSSNVLRIHGLWPSFSTNEYIEYCNKGESVKIPNTDIDKYPFDYMKEYWPSVGNMEEKSFWEHQYNKHGYCYISKQKTATYVDYFIKTVSLYKKDKYETLMSLAFTKLEKINTVTYTDLVSRLKEKLGSNYFDISCLTNSSTDQYLFEIKFYYDLNFEKKEGVSSNTNCDKNKQIMFSSN